MGVQKRDIPSEVTAFKEKFFFGLTVRQLLCVAVILALAIPTGIFGGKIFPSDVVQYMIVFEVIPLAAIGFLKYNDMPVETVSKKILMYYFGNQKRKYKYIPAELYVHDSIRDINYDESVIMRKTEIKANLKAKKEQKKNRK